MECVRLIMLWVVVLVVSAPESWAESTSLAVAIKSENFSVFKEDGKVGLKDNDGRIVIPANYEAIGWASGELSIIDKVVGYRSNGLWGLIHTSNKVLTPPQYLDLRPGEGSYLIAQQKSEHHQRPSFGVIDLSGKTVIPFVYDGITLSNMRAITMLRSGGNRFRVGLTDLSHKVLIPVDYQRIYPLGSLRYAVENAEHKFAIFSDTGNQMTGFTIDSIAPFENDFAIIYQDQKQGMINRQGELVIKPVYAEVQVPRNGTIRVRVTDAWHFLDGNNKPAGEFRADEIRPVSSDHYIVRNAGKVQLTDNNFKPLHEDYFSFIGPFRKGRAVFVKNARMGVITLSGEVLLAPLYPKLEMDDNLLRACVEPAPKPRWVLMDYTGKQRSEKHYEYIGPYNGKYYPAKSRGYWGALDAAGKEIISCVHDSLLHHSGNYIAVKFKDQYGVINLGENWVVTPQKHRIKILNADTYFEFAEKTTFLKSLRGGIIYFSDNHLAYDGEYIREELHTGAHWLIDMNGIIIDRSHQPERTEKIFKESEGLRAIIKDGKYGFIDAAGRLRIANRYERARPFSHGLAAIMIAGKWGFIDHEERLVVQPVYDRVEDFSRAVAVVQQGHYAGLIDVTGKVCLPVRYNAISMNEHNRFILRQGDEIGLADETGRVIVNPRYDKIIDPDNGYLIVVRNGKYGALTMRGVSTIPMVYDALMFDAYHQQFIAQKKSDWETVSIPQSAVR